MPIDVLRLPARWLSPPARRVSVINPVMVRVMTLVAKIGDAPFPDGRILDPHPEGEDADHGEAGIAVKVGMEDESRPNRASQGKPFNGEGDPVPSQ